MGNTGYNVQPNLLFWVNLKTLTHKNCINRILQIAYVYTDYKLSTWHPGSQFTIHCKKQEFQQLDTNQLKVLKDNGLYQECINSKINVQDAQDMILKDIQFRKFARGQLLAAGKQIHLAKYALMVHMPKLHDFLHYRIFDISSVELIIQRFHLNSCQKTKKQQKRAKQQVWQDINQMQFYYQHALNEK